MFLATFSAPVAPFSPYRTRPRAGTWPMAPRARLSDAVFERRKRAFVNDQTTSHWPIRFDADAPRATPIRSASELSPIRRWLVGYRDDDEL